MAEEFLGLRSLIYPAPDLEKSRSWWSQILGKEPYFDDGGYVGFDVGGFEIGLNSHSLQSQGPVTYLGVSDLTKAVSEMKLAGAKVLSDPMDVGGGIHLAEFLSPQGEVFGLIFNPHFKIK